VDYSVCAFLPTFTNCEDALVIERWLAVSISIEAALVGMSSRSKAAIARFIARAA
jgi:hypothetical protein